MTDWQSVRAGTRLWRGIVVVLCTTYFLLFGLQVGASFELGLARGLQRPAAEWATHARFIMVVAFFTVTTITDLLALRVAQRWRKVPEAARGRANTFGAAAIIAAGLTVGSGIMYLVDSDTAGSLLGLSLMVGWLKMAVSLSLQRGCLDALHSPVGRIATALNFGIIGVALMQRMVDPIMAASIWAGLGFMVIMPVAWLVFFVIFSKRALAEYADAIAPNASAFD